MPLHESHPLFKQCRSLETRADNQQALTSACVILDAKPLQVAQSLAHALTRCCTCPQPSSRTHTSIALSHLQPFDQSWPVPVLAGGADPSQGQPFSIALAIFSDLDCTCHSQACHQISPDSCNQPVTANASHVLEGGVSRLMAGGPSALCRRLL